MANSTKKCIGICKFFDLCPKTIRKYYYHNPDFRKHIVFDNHYQVTVVTTVAIYDLSDDPLDQQYRSAILNFDGSIVLSTQSTNMIINTIFRNITVGGAQFQKLVATALKHKYRNSIALGDYAYFAHRGYTNGNASWVALHLLRDYQYYVKENKLVFVTHPIGCSSIRVTLHDVANQILERLSQTLKQNINIRKVLYDHLCGVLFYNLSLKFPIVKRSLLVNCDLIDKNYKPCFIIAMCELVTMMCSLNISNGLNIQASSFGLTVNKSDIKYVTRCTMRERTNN